MDEELEKLLQEPAEETETTAEALPTKSAPRGFVMSKATYYALLVIFAGVFILSGIYLFGYFSETGSAENDYNQLESLYQQNTQATTPTVSGNVQSSQPTETQPPTIHPSLQPIHALNDDVIGWLNMSDIKISYPVVQCWEDEDFYLSRDFYGKENIAGCPYIPWSCDAFKPSDNLIIYGHNLRSGGMFRNLTKYDEKSYWEQHPTFTFQSLYGEPQTYRIFAVFKTAGRSFTEDGNPWGYPYHTMSNFDNEEEFNQFIANVKGAAFQGKNAYKGASFYDTGITPVYGDKLICLSTCEYTIRDPDGSFNGRLVVMAVRED